LIERARFELQRFVRRMPARSLRTGNTVAFDFRGWRVSVLIRADNGHEAYIAVAAAGMVDPPRSPAADGDPWHRHRRLAA